MNMLKNLTQLYCLIVCLVSTIILMITLGLMFNYTTEIILTEYKNAKELNKFSSNDKYIEYRKHIKCRKHTKCREFDEEKIDDIEVKRLLEKENFIENKKKEAISSIISCMAWLFVSILFFIVHWRMHKKYSLVN